MQPTVTTHEFATRTRGNLCLDLHHPDTQTRQLVVYLFGGGFAKGNRKQVQDDPMIKHLCDQGYAVAVPDYRLLTTWDDIPAQKAQQVRQVANRVHRTGLTLSRSLFGVRLFTGCEDVSNALQYCKDHAAALNIKADKIGVIGISAGGIIGNTLCYPPGGCWSNFVRPDAMVSLAAPIVHPWRLNANGPPLWVIHGQHDKILPSSDSALSQTFALQAKAPVTTHIPPDAPHIQIVRYVMENARENGTLWTDDILSFFDDHLDTPVR